MLPQIKLISELSSCASFYLTVMATGEVTQSGLPSFTCTPGRTGNLIPAAAPCVHPLPWGVQTNLVKSLLALESPIFFAILCVIWWWNRLPDLTLLDMLGECVISSILCCCNKDLKWQTSVTAWLQLRVLFRKQRIIHPWRCEGRSTPKARPHPYWLSLFISFASSSPKLPYAD